MAFSTNNYKIDVSLIPIISPIQAWHYRICPSQRIDNLVIFYIDSSLESEQIKIELELLLGLQILFDLVSDYEIEQLLQSYYRSSSNKLTTKTAEELSVDTDNYLNKLIEEADALHSSDVHIEVYEAQARVRYRIDGLLVERYRLDKHVYPSVINKIKIQASLDIAEKRLPQDGRIFFTYNEGKFDIRVSVLPTLYGEKIVLRLLKTDKSFIDIEKVGFTDAEREFYMEGINKPHGIILISGPTGSGKTTTLYATLNYLNKSTKNILTVEDPIEYTLEGINQVQVKESIGLTFASALRTFLRQDPDIIMLGEIRDGETASMAIRAALTGHLVLSTIHTNSAWGTVSRLNDVGVPPFLLSDTLILSVAQRLVRLLCPHCKVLKSFDVNKKFGQFQILEGIKTQYLPVGCSHCYYTGYKGRKAIYEVIKTDETIAAAIRNKQNNISAILAEKNINTLADNAIVLFKNGLSSFDEILPILLSY